MAPAYFVIRRCVRFAPLLITDWRRVKTVLAGADLLALGFQEGPAVGVALRTLLDARLDGRVATREEEIALARRLFETHKSR